MIPLYKIILIFFVGLILPQPGMATPAPLTVVEKVMQQGFPSQPDVLLKTSQDLFDVYQHQKKPIALVFYSYAMLQLANHFELVNDYVKASEYAKLGFFFLDEAVEANEENLRIRYLRSRVDAYLPAKLGRCVVTLHDTDVLLKEEEKLDVTIMEKVNFMRYHALVSCSENSRAAALMKAMENGSQSKLKQFDLKTGNAPEWDVNEINKILSPLMQGE